MAARSIRLDVVVPVYNKRGFLAETVASIRSAAHRHGAAQVCFVDNGSTDGSLEYLESNAAEFAAVVRASADLTIAAVRNLGAATGVAPVIAFLDCDCVVDDSHFLAVETVFNEHPEAAVAGCKIALPLMPTWVEKAWNDLHDDRADGERPYINSANMAVRRPAFEAVGGFLETLETGEDAELCQRLRAAGGGIYQDQRLRVVHLDNAKTLAAFFRKERWRGLGMLGTVSLGSIDKPTAMTVLHLALLVAVAGLAWIQPGGPVAWLAGCLACVSIVPAVTVLYRRRSLRHRVPFWPAFVLYELYYLARISALVILAGRKARRIGQRVPGAPSVMTG